MPLARQAFTISVMTGAKIGRMSRRRLVGIGSKGQEAFDAFLMMEVISETVAGLKLSNLEEEGIRSEFRGGHCKLSIDVSILARRVLIFDIFDTKNSLKV